MLSSLPATLLTLLFALPILSAQTSSNDPFHAISTHAPKVPQDPVCCLKPLPSLEPQPSEEELLLSFEDWKAKLLAEEKSNAVAAHANDSVKLNPGTDPVGGGNGAGGGGKEGGSDSSAVAGGPLVPSTSGATSFSLDQLDAGEQLSPHFRVPLTDRFNYASLDCSARVHTSHRSAKSTSSILSSKKDRYMLSPCSTEGKEENHFVVVELCDDIRIDTVQLANFEFFSGVFKDLTVSVAKTYTTEPEAWINAGTYRAKNVRGVQSFHPPTSLRDFFRYIRIDFHSHYGNEYYCPVSLLRVFGLTHLEEWKLDVWESESRAKRSGQLIASPDTQTSVSLDVPISSLFPSSIVDAIDHDSGSSVSISVTTEDPQSSDSSHHFHSTDWTSDETTDQYSPDTLSTTSVSQSGTPSNVSIPDTQQTPLMNMNDSETTTITTVEWPVSQTNLHSASKITTSMSTTSEIASNSATSSSAPPDSGVKPSQHSAENIVSVTGDLSSTLTSRPSSVLSSTPITSLSSQALLNSPHPSSGGGESIYRTIMNRLTVLELNTTLYTRYVEEQTAGVREVLRRLGEDVGRLEGLGKAQAQMYQRSLLEMERQRRRLELEHTELMSRVNYLAEEVVMEKRLGIAQLCLLVAVLVFMALTRGSRGELIDHRPAVLQKFSRGSSWGQRTLSLSGDWVRRFRSRSPKPKSVDANSKRQENDQTAFPIHRVSATQTPPANSSRPAHISTSTSVRRTTARPRTPQSRAPGRHLKPSTPTATHSTPLQSLLFPPMLSRASSQGHTAPIDGGFVGPVPKSAKKWARTAHLHQVKNAGGREGNRAGERTPLRPNVDTSTPQGKDTGRNVESEVDVWVDTDDTASDADFVQENYRHGSHHSLVTGSSATLTVGA